MSDPLLDFLLSRDKKKVMAEAVPVPLERLYAEASIADRELIDELPIGVLRKKLLEAEVLLASRGKAEVKYVGSEELLKAMRRQNVELQKLKQRNAELRELLNERAAAA